MVGTSGRLNEIVGLNIGVLKVMPSVHNSIIKYPIESYTCCGANDLTPQLQRSASGPDPHPADGFPISLPGSSPI
jgi:hypothetical protein